MLEGNASAEGLRTQPQFSHIAPDGIFSRTG
jgi:hypothetical protein